MQAEEKRRKLLNTSCAEDLRYRERSTVERVNARLKDEFGGRMIRVRGHAKVMCHPMFGILSLAVNQILRLIQQTVFCPWRRVDRGTKATRVAACPQIATRQESPCSSGVKTRRALLQMRCRCLPRPLRTNCQSWGIFQEALGLGAHVRFVR